MVNLWTRTALPLTSAAANQTFDALIRCQPFPPQLQALYDGQYVDAHFTRSFYKHMLGQVGNVTAVKCEMCLCR